MPSQPIDPDVRAKLEQELVGLLPGTCFTRCQLASFADAILRCQIGMPDRIVRFMVTVDHARDAEGDPIEPGQVVRPWESGWVRGTVAGIGNGESRPTIVRIHHDIPHVLEMEVESGDVVARNQS